MKPHRSARPSLPRRFAGGTLALGLLVGLGTSAIAQSPAASGGSAFPITVENCSRTTTYEAPPERAVAVNQPTVETLLDLGVTDRVVGTSYAGHGLTGIREDLLPAYEAVPILSTTDVSKEALLSVEPDFIVASFESSFGEEKGLSRDALGELGIASHVLYETCIPRPSVWDDIHGEIATIGAIFGADARAAEVVARMQAEVATAQATAAELPTSPRVFVYDSGEAAPFTAGGAGIENLMITTAGGTNIFADIDKSFGEATWEEVVARDPEIIVINDYQDDTHASPPLDQKIAFLRGNPALADVSAIVNDRIVPVSLHHVFLSVRNSDATAALAEAFASALSR